MSKVRVELDPNLERILARATGRTALARIAQRLQAEAEAMADHAREQWPVGRDNTGRPSVRKSRTYNSRDRFAVVGRITTSAVEYRVLNDAPWAYKIRSRQVIESESERQRRFFWPNGESPDDHWARAQVGRKKHAWGWIVLRRERQRRKGLVNDLARDVTQVAEGR